MDIPRGMNPMCLVLYGALCSPSSILPTYPRLHVRSRVSRVCGSTDMCYRSGIKIMMLDTGLRSK